MSSLKQCRNDDVSFKITPALTCKAWCRQPSKSSKRNRNLSCQCNGLCFMSLLCIWFENFQSLTVKEQRSMLLWCIYYRAFFSTGEKIAAFSDGVSSALNTVSSFCVPPEMISLHFHNTPSLQKHQNMCQLCVFWIMKSLCLVWKHRLQQFN